MAAPPVTGVFVRYLLLTILLSLPLLVTAEEEDDWGAVSYTHLTLPTILLV